MNDNEQQVIEDITSKYGVSTYRLMDYLGITYKSGKYTFEGVFYDNYVEALKIADSSFERLAKLNNSKEIDKNTHTKGELAPETKIMNGIFLVGLILWPAFLIASIMMFDAPGSENNIFGLLAAFTIWSYPVVFFIARRKSYSAAKRDNTSKNSFYWSCIPFINIFLFWFMFALAKG